MPLILARIGASFYVLWGLLHLLAAWRVYELAMTLEAGPVQGRVVQNGLFRLFLPFWRSWSPLSGTGGTGRSATG